MIFSVKPLFKRFFQEPPLGWAQLSHQKVRLLVALSGIAFADILIFMQLGFKNLLYEGATLVHRNLQGDIVLISNRTDRLGDSQTFSRRYLYQAAAVEGFESTSPLYYSWATWVNPWAQEVTEVAVIAFDPVQPVGTIFNFGTIMGFIVGVVVVNQVLYSDVNDHLAEYATLKVFLPHLPHLLAPDS